MNEWMYVCMDGWMNEWMNEWMNDYDLGDAVTETVAGALYRN